MPLPAGSAPVTILSGPIVYDPVLSRVRITTTSYLNANPFFETDALSWTGNGGSVARSTAQFHEGVASLLLTPDGVTGFAQARANPVTVTAGQSYRGSAWVRCDVARTVRITVDWLDAIGGILSSSNADVAVAATTWTLLEVSGTAPAAAVQARLVVWMQLSPSASHLLYIDEAMIEPSPVVVERSTDQVVWTTVRGGVLVPTAGAINLDDYEFAADVLNHYRIGTLFSGSITPVLDGVWLKSLARPFLNRKVRVWNWSDVERTSRSGVFPIVGRSMPVAVTDLHGSRQWTLQVRTATRQEAQDLDLLISTGEVQFVHVPANSAVPGGYVALGATSEAHFAHGAAPRRVISMPFTECAAPGPDVIPAIGTCQTVLNVYATCSAVLAAHPTCADLLNLIGSPADVVVP